jgi:polyhydroxybutyrate depolymerase
MLRFLPAFVVVIAACESPLPDVVPPDAGSQPLACFQPLPGGVFLAGLPAPVAGCSAPQPDAGVLPLDSDTWKAGGVLVVPPSAPGTPLPLVIAFHQAGGSGIGIRNQLGMEAVADGGAIFVYPNASRGTWDLGQGDGRAVDLLLRSLSQTYCIDPSQIHIAGFSAGAVFTLYLACNVPTTFASAAAVAGTEDVFDTRCCSQPISALFIHGVLDDTIPAGEGHNAADEVGKRDGCGINTTVQNGCDVYACPAPRRVQFCPWEGNHEVPDFAGQAIWNFFSAN